MDAGACAGLFLFPWVRGAQ